MSKDATTTERAVRAVIADGEPTVRRALRDLSVQSVGMQVVGEAADGAALERMVRAEQPDLVILAWDLVVASAGLLLHALRDSCRTLRIVVLGPRPDTHHEALAAGADAYICMVDAPDVVTAALRTSPGRAASETETTKRCRMSGGEKTNEPGGPS